MKLDFGTNQRFLDFMEGISKKDKIAIVSHTDMDGMAAAKVIAAVVKAEIVKFVNYEQLNSGLTDELKRAGVNKVIFSDLYIKTRDFLKPLEEFAEILIIDHHIAEEDWNSKRTTFIKCEAGYCAGYLCYRLFSEVTDIEALDWIVACSCVSDYCHIKPAAWLEQVFDKYGDRFEQVGRYVRTSGRIWDLQETLSLALIYFKDDLNIVFEEIGTRVGDIGKLGAHADEVRKEINRLVKLFEKEKEPFPDGYLFNFDAKFACGSMAGSIISGKYENKTLIMVSPTSDKKLYKISLRRQDKKADMDALTKSLLKGMDGADGGGHVAAAGGRFPAKYLAEFRKRLGVVSQK
jgi:single-stranded DNA-specific DHH superfamily exonuclease